MKKHSSNNERIKRKYLAFLKEAKRHSEPTVDAAAKALSRFEAYTRYRDFKAVHFEQAIALPIRAIFHQAFISAGLPYFNPNSCRNTLVQLGEEVCKTPEQFKAWSQNLGREKVLTTFLSYGEVACQRQREIIRNLAAPKRPISTDAYMIAETVFRKLHSSEMDFKKKPGP